MNKILLITTLLITGAIYAQDINPKFEKEGELIKGTFYYENGNVKQAGTYNAKGKLQGKWIAYDKAGKKTAVAQYTNGKKNGKWLFWNNGHLTKVNYSNNTIVNVNSKK